MHGGGVASGGSVAKGKRKTSHQLAILEKTYAENSFPSEQLRAKLSVQLDLTEPQVDNWFRYRRSKDERWSCYRRSKDKKRGSDKIGYNPWRNTNNCTPKKKLKSSDSEDASDSSDSDGGDAPFKKKQCGLVDNVSPMPDSSSDSEDASDSSDSDGGDVPFKKKQCGLVDNVSPMPISTGYNMGKTKKRAWRNTNNCIPKKKLKSSDSEDASDSDDSSDSDDADVLLFKKKCRVLVDKVSPMPNSTGYNMGKTKKCAWRNTNNCIPKKKPKSSDSEDVSDSDSDSDSNSDVGALFKKKHRELVDSVSPMSDCLLDGGGGGDSGGDGELLVPKPEQCELAENVSPMSDSLHLKSVMACNDEVVMVLETKRNPQVWKHFDLCLMSDSHEMARCKGCGKFMKATANSTLRKHTDRHCPVTKATAKKSEGGESSGTGSSKLEVSSSYQSDVVCIQGYKVKRSNATILEAIIKKHGDIAVNCVFKTDSVRSSILEVVCEVVRRIQTDNVIEIGEDIERQLSDAEAANINVSWIRAHFEAFNNRKETSKTYSLLTEMKLNTVLVKRAAQMDLRDKSAKLVAAQEEFKKVERCVQVLHLVEKNLNDNILESKSKLDSWVKPPVV
ncbi:dentin sialophosphoprotein isoform X3 [Helianthus annuus]|uniref:dentin sialophosphoprotein isoform X3 n=1 Tax=Helianthus annuus TaxID=4232 RepID=UPI000B908FDC|nr:dentin sialophosphoprotein isoform X3 [Helianthus annuus]